MRFSSTVRSISSRWGIWAILQSLAKAAYLNPLAAALSVHLTVGALGLLLLMKEDI